jgi:hypothetical protein
MKMIHRFVLAGGLAWLAPIVAGGGTAQASIVVALDLPDLVREAERIAVVDVVSVRAAWDDKHERIFSTIELDVIESWKGAALASKRVTVVQPGGTVDDISMVVTGTGRFSPGERSLVFLRGPAGRSQLVGMAQGKRPMRFETASRRWLVAPPDMAQLKTVRRPGATAPAFDAKRGSAETGGGAAAGGKGLPPQGEGHGLAPSADARRERAIDEMRAEIQRLLQVGAR